MDYSLMIRVECIDGDVDYHECKPEYVIIHDKAVTLNLFQIHDDLYPEYRMNDLLVSFVKVTKEVN